MKKNDIIVLIALTLSLGSCTLGNKETGPADPAATTEAKALYAKMKQLTSKGIMIGHQDDIVYGHSWKSEGVSDIKQVCGDFPAVFGWELGDLELGHKASLDSVSFDEIRRGIQWVHAQGGINTISWHGNNALTGGNAWDVSTDQVVKSILPGGEKHDVYMGMLEKLSDFFLSLTDEKGKPIPFIFRPYHEHTGSWFWWGQKLCTTEEYLQLWKISVDFFRSKGLNNMLYAYSPASGFESSKAYLERYPGDDQVDFLGFDCYQGKNNDQERYRSALRKGSEIIVALSQERGKIAILAETGFEAIPDSAWWTSTLWPAVSEYPLSYILFWRNAHDKPNHYYAPFPQQTSAADFVEFEKIERTLFLKDIQ
jgi:mannan endo-1,4-beta-mannosidase